MSRVRESMREYRSGVRGVLPPPQPETANGPFTVVNVDTGKPMRGPRFKHSILALEWGYRATLLRHDLDFKVLDRSFHPVPASKCGRTN